MLKLHFNLGLTSKIGLRVRIHFFTSMTCEEVWQGKVNPALERLL
jgi:hypothetical protein